jgi:hypothetical protein
LRDKPIANLNLARQIRAARRRIYIAEDDGEAGCIPSDGLRVYQWGGKTESCVTAIKDYGGIAVIIYLTVTFELPNFAISAFGLELPWENNSFWWLPDPRESFSSTECYSFGGREFPEFERDRVLNHHADVRQTYSKRRSLKGALLGFGLDPIPREVGHGVMIPAFVHVYDQLRRVCRCPVQLWADRSLLMRSRVPQKRSGLFEQRDAGFEDAPVEEEEEANK